MTHMNAWDWLAVSASLVFMFVYLVWLETGRRARKTWREISTLADEAIARPPLVMPVNSSPGPGPTGIKLAPADALRGSVERASAEIQEHIQASNRARAREDLFVEWAIVVLALLIAGGALAFGLHGLRP